MFLTSLAVSTFAEVPMIVAHRGASRDAPANTIPAFELAWKQDADAVEGDFHLTKDGEIVCIHDGDTKRVAGRNLVVSESTLAELKKLDVGACHAEKYRGIRIPTLAEVFSTVPEEKRIYIEVKCGAGIISPLLKQIEKSGLASGQIVVISFNGQVIQELKARAPQYKALWLCSFKERKSGVITPTVVTVLNTLKRIQADGFSSNTAVPESYIEAVREQGYEWHVWTVDDIKTANRMTALGASSITTNVPQTIRTILVGQSPAGDVPKAVPEG